MRSDRWMLAALALCLGGAAHGQSRVENVFSSSVAGRTEVVVEGKDLARPRMTPRNGGRTLTFEFRGGLVGRPRTMAVNAKGLKSVRVGWQSARPPVVRVDLRLDQGTPIPSMVKDARGWRLAFGTTSVAPVAVKKPVSEFDKMPPMEPKTEVRVAEVVPLIPGLTAGTKQPITVLSAKTSQPTTLANVFPAAPPMPKPEEMRVTLDFVNTDIVQILKALALQAGVNVVTAPEVKGSLTVSLHDVTVESALKLVTSLAGIAYTQVAETYIVATPDRLETVRRQVTGEAVPTQATPVSEAYIVRGGKAVDLVAAVAGKDKTEVGGVSLIATPVGSASSQAIVLHGPAAEVARVKAVFEQIDKQGADGETFEIYEVRHVNPSALREDLLVAVPGLRATVAPASVLNPQVYKKNERADEGVSVGGDLKRLGGKTEGGGGAEASGTDGSADAKAREDIRDVRNARGLMQPFSSFEAVGEPMRLVLRGTPQQIKLAREYAAKVDLAPRQVALELRVMELNKEEALKVGIDWSILGTSGLVRALRVNQGFGDQPSAQGTVSGNFSGTTDVIATLDQLSNKRNLIARPNLLAIDGRESELFVGDVVRYIKSIQATQNGVTVIVDEERVGVRLAVFPRVGTDGQISLDLRPVLSYLRGFTAVPGGGQLPQTSERMTQATAVIRSGETIALGGLILDQDRKEVRGIPFLRDLPIIGQLFRRTDNSKARTEVVFFLTAKSVEPPAKVGDPAIERADAARPKG
ncbi:MAG: type II secretion system protein GspD [Fimbriimonas sp.]